LPKIIRSSGVNIENADPVAAPLVGQQDEAEIALPQDQPAREPQMDQIYASAELFVEEIISKARNDADNMLVDARRETIQVLQEAVRDGWDQGMSQALKEMQAMQSAAAQEVDTAIESLMIERKQMIKDLERNILALVFDMVDKVLSVEMDRSTQWIEAMVKTALQQMEGDDTVVLKVSAQARQKVADIAVGLLAAAGKQPSHLTIAASSALKPGGCIIETARGTIDNSVEGKLDKLKTTLRENA
jgi:flagellar assembly protein FliH